MEDFTKYANSIFEQPIWLDIVAHGQWEEVLVKDGDKVIARMPYVFKHGNIVMPPFTQTLGPWIAPEYREFQRGNAQLRKQKEIIAELLSQLPAYKSFSMTFDSANKYILPYRWYNFSFASTFSYRIENLSDIDGVYANFGKTVLKNIKTARHKVQIIESNDSDKMLELRKMTFKAQGRDAKELNVIQKIIESSIEKGIGKLLFAVDEKDNVHTGGLFIYDKDVCYYRVGASNPKFLSSGAASLLLWKAIQFSSKVSKSFDFEGSMVEGIENFFRQFGGRQIINYHVTKNGIWADIFSVLKPRVKKILGYKN